jgi:hypothetical protein
VIDSARRAYDSDPAHYGTFDKVKVACLETLMLRVPPRGGIGDTSADSILAGTLYTRGTATDQHGNEITDAGWGTNTAQSCMFDTAGHLLQDAAGNLVPNHFLPQHDSTIAGRTSTSGTRRTTRARRTASSPRRSRPRSPTTAARTRRTQVPGTRRSTRRSSPRSRRTRTARSAADDLPRRSGIADHDAGALQRATTIGNRSSYDRTAPAGNLILTGTTSNPIVIEGTVAIAATS